MMHAAELPLHPPLAKCRRPINGAEDERTLIAGDVDCPLCLAIVRAGRAGEQRSLQFLSMRRWHHVRRRIIELGSSMHRALFSA